MSRIRNGLLVGACLLGLLSSANGQQAPALLAPADQEMDVSPTATFTWASVPGVDEYEFAVRSTDSPGPFLMTTTADTTLTVTLPIADWDYAWKARSIANGNTGAWSAEWTFSTGSSGPYAPVPISPVDGAAEVNIPVLFSWSAASDAAAYHIQVAENEGFVKPHAINDTLNDTQVSLTTVAPGTTYFWRVRGIGQDGSFTWSAARTFSTITGTAGTPVLSAPQNGASGVSTSPLFQWNDVGNATEYELEIRSTDTAGPFEVRRTTETQLQIPMPIADWPYAWRVRAYLGTEPGAWSAEWQFTTATTGPLVPQLTSPAANATDVSVPTIFQWTAAPSAVRHHIQVAQNEGFVKPHAINDTLNGTSVTLSNLAGNTTYYWRVRGISQDGSFTWTAVRMFETAAPVVTAPTLTSPSNGASSVSTQATFVWSAVPGATEYELNVRSADTNDPFRHRRTTNTQSTETLPIAEWDYAWRVRAFFGSDTGPWSSEWTFKTAATGPLAPVPSAPADGATGLSIPVLLRWSQAPAAQSYHVQVAQNEGFVKPHAVNDTLNALQVQVTNLSAGTRYFWRVRGLAGDGSFTFSKARTFTTATGPLAAPALTSPSNGASGVSTTLELRWTSIQGATEYEYEVRHDQESGPFIANRLAQTQQTVTVPVAESSYWWRVRAHAGSNPGLWSQEWNFQAGQIGPLAPQLVSPEDGLAGLVSPVRLQWTPARSAATQHVQISSSSGFDTGFVVDDTLEASQSELSTELAGGTTYYWRIRGINVDGTYTWSRARSFSTASGTATEDELPTPSALAIRPNWPNPIVNRTSFLIALPGDGPVSLEAFDLLGRKVDTILAHRMRAGRHEIEWRPDLPGGTYLVRLATPKGQAVVKSQVIGR